MNGHDARARARRQLIALMAAVTIGQMGRQLSMIAIPWYVLETTGSAARTGIVAAAVLLPGFLVGMFGGVLVDRLGYRRVSIVSDLVCAVATLLIPLLHATIGLSFGMLLLLVFLGSLLDVPALTARRSMVPELASGAALPIDRVNAWFESLQNLAVLVGTPLAGLAVALLGTRNALWLDGTASAISAGIVAMAIPAGLFASQKGQLRTYREDLVVGLRFIRRDPILWPMVIMLALSNATSVASAGVVLPVYFREEIGSTASLGLVMAAIGGGAFVGAMAYGAFIGRVSRIACWIVGFLLVPLEFWIYLVSPGVALLAATQFVVGILMGPINPIMVSLRHERSPRDIRGRVFSTYSAIAMAAQPLGVVVAGNLIERFGFVPAVAAIAVVAQGIGLASLLIPGFRRMDDAPVESPEPLVPASLG